MKTKHAALFTLLILGTSWACGGGSITGGDADVQQEDMDAADTADMPADRDAVDLPQDGDASDPAPDPVDVHEEDAAQEDLATDVIHDGADAEDVTDDELPSGYDGVLCGYDICLEPEICCWRDGYPPAPECMTEAACLACDSCFFPQRCDGPEDCRGSQNCCYYGDEFLPESTCTSAAECDRQCHDEDDCDTGELCCGYLTEHHILLDHCYAGEICPP